MIGGFGREGSQNYVVVLYIYIYIYIYILHTCLYTNTCICIGPRYMCNKDCARRVVQSSCCTALPVLEGLHQRGEPPTWMAVLAGSCATVCTIESCTKLPPQQDLLKRTDVETAGALDS